MADELNLQQMGTLPPELYAQQQQLNRQQQMASMLMQQNQQPQGQMISGHYVAPSWSQQLAPVANMLAGAYLTKQGDTKATELAQALREGKNASEEKILQALTPQANGQPNYSEAARLIRTNEYGAGKEYMPQIIKNLAPESPASVQEFNYAKAHPEYAQYTFQKARASAPSIVNQMGASASGKIGDILEASRGNAVNAQNTLVSADKILGALQTNQAVTGPAAEARLQGVQIANFLGAGGKNDADKIANSRVLLQETAKLALAAPVKGQGSVDRYERGLMQKAASGDLNFTPTELGIIANRAKDNANYQLQQHNDLLKSAQNIPEMRAVVPFYNVNAPMPVNNQAPQANQNAGANKVKYLGPAND